MPRTYEHTMGSILIRKWVIGAPAVEPEVITPVAVKPYTLKPVVVEVVSEPVSVKPELTTSEAKAGWQFYPEPIVAKLEIDVAPAVGIADDGIPEPVLRVKKLSAAAQAKAQAKVNKIILYEHLDSISELDKDGIFNTHLLELRSRIQQVVGQV